MENRFMKTKLNEMIAFEQFPTDREDLITAEKDGKLEIRSGTVEALTELLYNQNQSARTDIFTFLVMRQCHSILTPS
jgi:hypothetical protein